jgi:GT2 family glycosyltransferase
MSQPFVSIVVPVWHPDAAHFQAAIDSVLAQDDGDWELILVADGPQPQDVQALLAADDPRIKVIERSAQGGIVAATNDGLEVAQGEFIGFLDNDDTLAPRAVAACREVAARWPDVDVMYSDEDKLDEQGYRTQPFHKPAWSPERLLCQMYLGHLCVYRRTLVEDVGYLRQEFNGSQDFDLALRTTERARRIVHIPEVLYHWRMAPESTALNQGAKMWAFDAGVAAVQDALDRRGIPASANMHSSWPGIVCLDPAGKQVDRVSIVILTGGGRRVVRGAEVVLVEQAVASVVAETSHDNYEIIVVFDRTSTEELITRVEAVGQGKVRSIRNPKAFNYSEGNNIGASYATGDLLVFLNDDTEVITPDWLERLLLFSSFEGVGAVGTRLEYSDGRIQHAGVAARGGGPSHQYVGYANDHPGEFGALAVTRNVIGATGACLAVRTERFGEVGGFTTALPLNFNDVDFCLKFIRNGYRNVVDMRTRLVHHESSTRKDHVDSWEHQTILRRWGVFLHADPWDNPNFLADGVVQIAPAVHITAFREALGAPVHPPRPWPLDPLGEDAAFDRYLIGNASELLLSLV